MTWTTEFNTSKETMTHVFNEHVSVVTDFKATKVYLIRFGEKMAEYELEGLSIKEYTGMLARIELDSRKLAELQEVEG